MSFLNPKSPTSRKVPSSPQPPKKAPTSPQPPKKGSSQDRPLAASASLENEQFLQSISLKEGWLMKQGHNVIKDWKKRWFVLKTWCLFYFEKQTDCSTPSGPNPLGSILLTHCSVKIATNSSKKFALELSVPNRSYVVHAKDQEEMKSWFSVLSSAIENVTFVPADLQKSIKDPPSPIRQTHRGISSGSESPKASPILPNVKNHLQKTEVMKELTSTLEPIAPYKSSPLARQGFLEEPNDPSRPPNIRTPESALRSSNESPGPIKKSSPLSQIRQEVKHKRTGSTHLSDETEMDSLGGVVRHIKEKKESYRESTVVSASPSPTKKIGFTPDPIDRDTTPVSQATKDRVNQFSEAFLEQFLSWNQYVKDRRHRYEIMAHKAVSEGYDLNVFFQEESRRLRERRIKPKIKDFEVIVRLGKGGFGSVFLVRHMVENKVYAMKKMSKSTIQARNKMTHILTERKILQQNQNEWMIQLHSSFQDSEYLYLVMEYAPGGDLRSLINNFGSFPEADAKFYISEMLTAVICLHEMGYIHRDLKPDNFLIDRLGHIKLADFGLSKGGLETRYRSTLQIKKSSSLGQSQRRISTALNQRKNTPDPRHLAYSVVGSPDYMALELLIGDGYDFSVDFWSLGVILFELLAGLPPFFGETPQDVFANILNYETSLKELYETLAEDDIHLGTACWDLIVSLLQPPEKRLGRHGPEEIRKHNFFSSITDWNALRQFKPPFVPNLHGEVDYSYFDEAVVEEPEPEDKSPATKKSPHNLHFTWKKPLSYDDVKRNKDNLADQQHQ